MGGRINIGNHVGMSGVILSSRSSIEIGDYTKLGGNVRIFDHNYHSLNPDLRRNSAVDSQDVKTDSVLIGDDVFIGTNAIILKGTSIGARSVVGAGAVIAGLQIPDDSLVVGNPAKIITR
jgi:acetyltransferase-like isoleucine patch superfamily enzyme